MIAIPITMALIIMGLLFLQHNHYQFLERQENFVTPDDIKSELKLLSADIEQIDVELSEQTKRIDGLMLRAGFKL